MIPTEVGIRLITMAETYALPHLGRRPIDNAARIALTVMCLSAIDADPEPWYGGGWVPIGRALGLDAIRPRSAQVVVSRSLGPLTEAGLIERSYLTSYGTKLGRAATARWLIHIEPR